MSIIGILAYLIWTVFFFAVLTFAYYAFKNARLMQGPLGHQLMAAGAILFMAAMTICGIDHFFFPGSRLIYAEFIVWIAGLLYLVGGGWLRAKDIQRAHRISMLKIFTMMPHSKFYLVAIAVLVFISAPIFLWSVLQPIGVEFNWLDVINMGIWAFAFVSLIVGERMLYLSLGPPMMVSKAERRLLRGDIRALRARLDLTNSYLTSLAAVVAMGPLERILSQCAEDNPILLDGYKLVLPGKLRPEPLVENLDRIHPQEREQAIFRAFNSIDAGAVVLYARATSPGRATEVVNSSFKDGIKLHGALLYDYALPAMLFGNVLEPLTIKCKKGTREAVRKKISTLAKANPLIGKLEIEHDGRISLTSFYKALAPMVREERIERTISSFSTLLGLAYPIIQHDLGPDQTRELVTGAYSYLLSEYPALRTMIAKSRPKKSKVTVIGTL